PIYAKRRIVKLVRINHAPGLLHEIAFEVVTLEEQLACFVIVARELASDIAITSAGPISQLISIFQLLPQSDCFVGDITRPHFLGAIGCIMCSKRNGALAVTRFNKIPHSIKKCQPQASVNAVKPDAAIREIKDMLKCKAPQSVCDRDDVGANVVDAPRSI